MELVISDVRAGKTVKELLQRELKVSARLLTQLKFSSENGITVNGKHVTVRYILKSGDILRLALEDRASSEHILPVSLPLSIIYEDEDILLCNKPADMPTHPSHGHTDDTLANALAYYFKTSQTPFVFRPVNRLDRNTSGLVLVAKNRLASLRLYRSMTRGEISKTYLALLDGVPTEGEGVIDRYLCRGADTVICRVVCDPDATGAMRAITAYRTLCTDNGHTLVEVHPRTGRTHQIRVHFASIGCPIVGDDLYGSICSGINRHMLHAHELTFPHPTTGRSMTVCTPLAADFAQLAHQYFPKEDLGRWIKHQ